MIYLVKSHVGCVWRPFFFATSFLVLLEVRALHLTSLFYRRRSSISHYRVRLIYFPGCLFSIFLLLPAHHDGGSSFPIKIERLPGDAATERRCGDGIFIVVAQGNLLLSDAVLLWCTSENEGTGRREKCLSVSRKWCTLSVHSPVWR